MFKVYDTVWTMIDGKPQQRVVYAVAEEMAFEKGGATEIFYMIALHQCGAMWSNTLRRAPDKVFKTKDELLAAFVRENTV